MKILSIANQKGGVGKSTLTVHIAYAAVAKGLRILLVDMDAQGSLSLTFPKADADQRLMASHLYAEAAHEFPEPVDNRMAIIRADKALLSVDKAENKVLRRPGLALRRFAADYDVCLIDTPPLLGVRLIASLAASDYVITPVSVGLYELAGVADLLQTIHVVRTQGLNPRLRHLGILPVKINTRSGDQRQALEMLRARYGGAILDDALPERAPVRAAVAKRRPVWVATKGEGHQKAAQEWRAACSTILNKLGV